MPKTNARGRPYRSKIATIQEYTSFPQAEYSLPPEDIDLEPREGFAKHTLVGLNLYLTKMAQQFPGVLGIRTEDPMLPSHRGVDPLTTTERAMLEQAARSAEVNVGAVSRDGDTLTAEVTIANKAGHKFPSGVAFRRAFVAFEVRDADGTRALGIGTHQQDRRDRRRERRSLSPARLWWTPDCGARIDPEARAHQPHYQVIDKQNQAQIYQELAAGPADTEEARNAVSAPSPDAPLTSSFLSICAKVKDNRILPHGFLGLEERIEIATALGAKSRPRRGGRTGRHRRGPRLRRSRRQRRRGYDSLPHPPRRASRAGPPKFGQLFTIRPFRPFSCRIASVLLRAKTPERLYYLAGKLDTGSGPIEDWKLKVGQTARASVP